MLVNNAVHLLSLLILNVTSSAVEMLF